MLNSARTYLERITSNIKWGHAAAFFALGLGVIAFDIYFLTTFPKSETNTSEAQKEALAQAAPQPINDSKDSINVLLIGYGGEGHPGGTLADTLIVVNINLVTKKATFVSIPRDTWVAIPVRSDGVQKYKINMAHAIGASDIIEPNKQPIYRGEMGAGNLSKTASEIVTNLSIDYFVSIDFNRLIEAIDHIGGIDVDVPVAFDDYLYPVKGKENDTCGKSAKEFNDLHEKYTGFSLEKQFECRYEHLHFDSGVSHMDGETALKFVRSRHSEEHGGDFARSARQYAVLVAIKEKLFSSKKADDIAVFYEDLNGFVKTDFDTEALSQMVKILGSIKAYSFNSIHLTDQNVFVSSTPADGQYVLMPRAGDQNWEEVHQYIHGNKN